VFLAEIRTWIKIGCQAVLARTKGRAPYRSLGVFVKLIIIAFHIVGSTILATPLAFTDSANVAAALIPPVSLLSEWLLVAFIHMGFLGLSAEDTLRRLISSLSALLPLTT